MSRATDTSAPVQSAHLRARVGGYVVDMVILAAIIMIVTVISGFILLARLDWGTEDATDPQLYTFLGMIGAGVPLVWSALTLGLLLTRHQTAGQYVAGLKLAGEDGQRPSGKSLTGWYFCFNPLLFSWLMAGAVCLPLSAVIALAVSRATFVAFGVLVTVCVASPIIALISAVLHPEHRALHDRVAGVVVVPAE
jgi:hypothetical protein